MTQGLGLASAQAGAVGVLCRYAGTRGGSVGHGTEGCAAATWGVTLTFDVWLPAVTASSAFTGGQRMRSPITPTNHSTSPRPGCPPVCSFAATLLRRARRPPIRHRLRAAGTGRQRRYQVASTVNGAKSPSGQLAKSDPALINSTSAKQVRVVVKLDYDSLAAYRGGIKGLPGTSPAVTGKRLDPKGANATKYLKHVERDGERLPRRNADARFRAPEPDRSSAPCTAASRSACRRTRPATC